MPIIDVIFILVIFGFLLFGFLLGFIHTLGSNIGFFLGIFIASRTYNLFGGSPLIKIAVFIVIYIIVGRIVGLIFWLINKVFSLIKIIPFTKTIDRVLGALFGFTEGILIVTGIVFVISTQGNYTLTSLLAASKIAPIALKLSKILIPFVTDAFHTINTLL